MLSDPNAVATLSILQANNDLVFLMQYSDSSTSIPKAIHRKPVVCCSVDTKIFRSMQT